MKANKFFKKGFSPLVATILLIAFSVALTTAIINWRALFIGSTDICSNINFEIETFEDKQFCYKALPDGIEANFHVKNIGKEDITGLSIILIGQKGKKIFDISNISLKKNSLFDAMNLKIDYDVGNLGVIKKAYLLPAISNSANDICPGVFRVIEKISMCRY